MMRSKLFLLPLCVLLLLALAPAVRADTVFLEEFEGEPAGWSIVGGVEIGGGKAAIRDTGTGGYSRLNRTIDLAPGYYSIEFDYWISALGAPLIYWLDDENIWQPCDQCPEGGECDYTLPDLFWANLYFSLYEWSGIELFQNNGPTDPGDDRQHFYGVFQNPGSQITPMFEIFNDNFLDGDSLVYLDNIKINALGSTPIPEPGTLGFMVLGLMGIAFVGSKRLFH